MARAKGLPLAPPEHALLLEADRRDPLALGRAGFQPLAVTGHINDRCLISYRAPVAQLAPLLALAAGRAPLVVDAHAGVGFLSICAVDLTRMHIAGSPRALTFDNREMLYRLGVRLPSGAPTFLTLRSDVSAGTLATLGRIFSHYRPRRAALQCTKVAGRWRLACTSADGLADAEVEADLGSVSDRCESSVFPDAATAAAFLLGMKGSTAAGVFGLQVQAIEHGAWTPRFLSLSRRHFDFVETLGRRLGIAFRYDSTLYVGNVDQRWCASRCGAEWA